MRRALAPLSLAALACACWVENPLYGADGSAATTASTASATAATTTAASASESDASASTLGTTTASTASTTAGTTALTVTSDTGAASSSTDATTDATTGGGGFTCANASPGGPPLWVQRIGGNGDLFASEVAVAGDGSVFVVGRFRGAATVEALSAEGSLFDDEVFVVRLAADGSPLWLRAFTGPENDAGTAITVDAAGSAVIVGHFAGTLSLGGQMAQSNGGSDAFIARLDPQGELLWTRAFGSPQDDLLHDVALGVGGGIVASGTIGKLPNVLDLGNGVTIASDGAHALLVAFDPSGGPTAAITATSNQAGGTSVAANLTVGPLQEIYTAGSFLTGDFTLAGKTRSPQGASDHWIARLDNTVATWLLGGGDSALQSGRNVALDATAGRLYGSARFSGGLGIAGLKSDDGTPDAALFALDPEKSSPLWGRAVKGDGDMTPEGLAVDSMGRVRWAIDYRVGATVGGDPVPALGADVLLLTLDSEGTLLATRRITGMGEQEAEDLAAVPGGCLAVVGSFTGDLAVDDDPPILPVIIDDRDAFVLLLPP